MSLRQLVAAFDGDRCGGAGDGDDLALQMMPAQQAEQIVEEAQRADVARGADVEDRDVALDGDGAEGGRSVGGGGADDGAAFGRLVGVEDGHGNVVLDGGQQGCRVQHLGSEAGQLGGLMEADLGDALGLGTDARIGGENAADVGPDLDAGTRRGRRR